MTKEQANKIWKLAIEMKVAAVSYGVAKTESEYYTHTAILLMQAETELYNYLKENSNDTGTI